MARLEGGKILCTMNAYVVVGVPEIIDRYCDVYLTDQQLFFLTDTGHGSWIIRLAVPIGKLSSFEVYRPIEKKEPDRNVQKVKVVAGQKLRTFGTVREIFLRRRVPEIPIPGPGLAVYYENKQGQPIRLALEHCNRNPKIFGQKLERYRKRNPFA